MGISISTLLLGFHTVLECVAGLTLFVLGKPPDASNKKPFTGEDKLWKRWHASGLIAMGYLGYAGLTQPDLKPFVLQTCMLFHGTAGLAQLVAVKEGSQSVKEGVFGNMHMYIALGFAAAVLGYVE